MKYGHAVHDIIVELSNTNINYSLDKRTGWTPLHVAAKNNQERVVWHLLAAGADPSIKDHQKKTPRELATSPEVRRLLENDDWLQDLRTVFTASGKGLISGSKLRDFYTRKWEERSAEIIDPVWGGLLADSEIQPEDFDLFEPLTTDRV
jgi:hypothetical protein